MSGGEGRLEMTETDPKRKDLRRALWKDQTVGKKRKGGALMEGSDTAMYGGIASNKKRGSIHAVAAITPLGGSKNQQRERKTAKP